MADVSYCGASPSRVPQRKSESNGDGAATLEPARHEGDVWTIPTGHGEPRHGRIAAYDSHGSTLVEHSVQLTWEDEGSTQCRGPYSTRITLEVPSDR